MTGQKLFFLTCFTMLTSSALAQTERSDVQGKLQSVLCSDTSQLSAAKTIRLGIYDAQIDARIVESIAGNTVTKRMLEKKAKALAAMKHFQGYALGVCSDRKGWVAALPAPAPLIRTNDRISFKASDLKAHCRNYRVDYAALSQGESQQLAGTGKVETKTLAPGIIEVTCQPGFPRWSGPVVWYMAPTTQEFAGTEAIPATTEGTDSERLTQWISKVRKREHRSPMVANDHLNSAATLLTIDTSVTHNRTSTDSIRARAKAAGFDVLGEIRVRGQSIDDLAWMIWHSPRHRDLILSADATNVGLHVKAIGTELLAVILGAKVERPVTATRPKAPVKKSQ